MSATQAITLKQNLIDQLQQVTKTYLSDFGHLPDDKLGVSPMGAARTPLAFTAEVAGFNFFLAKVLAGEAEAIPNAEERAKFEASVDSREAATKILNVSVATLSAAIERLDDAALAETITVPWGSQLSRLDLANIAIQHTAYHDGQLNYIQTLYGDTEDHWR